jgi:hypothetical protein
MLDEYMGRVTTGNNVERFYPSEAKVATVFENLIGELARDEKLTPDLKRQTGPQGHIYFDSPTIAAAIKSHYATSSGEDVRYLRSEALRDSTHDQLVRFVRGCYTRYGDTRSRPILHGANLAQKFRLLAEVLRRVGCTDVTLYDDHTSKRIPTAYTLTFRPTQELIKVLGVSAEVTAADTKKLVEDHRTKVASLKPD